MSRYLAIIICAAIAAYVNLAGYINPDTGWLISAAERWLQGERLYVDVVETNPPLVIYLTALPIIIGQKLGFSSVESFIGFVALLSAISASVSVSIIKSKSLQYWLIFALILIPGVCFGQREHLFLLFFMPYLAQLFEQKKPAISTAVFAAIGLALKPYFLAFWVLAVLFSRVKILDVTNFIIGLILAVYAGFVYFYTPEYIELLPLLLKYYHAFAMPFDGVVKSISASGLFYLIPVIVLFIKYRNKFDFEIRLISMMVVAGIFYQVIQMKGWSNHALPTLFFAGILSLLMLIKLLPIRSELWARVILFISGLVLASQIGLGLFANYRVAARINDRNVTQLTELLDMYAANSYVYFMTFDLGDIYPAMNYTSAKSASRHVSLWMLPGMYDMNGKMQLQNGVTKFYKAGERADDETLLIAQILGDIAKKPPKLVLVSNQTYLNDKGLKFRFDFIKYLSQEPDFVRIFDSYRKVSEVGKIKIYAYDPS